MTRESTITQEQVNAVADTLRAGGSKPTARAVRDQLGTGSMATVLKLLQTWQAGQVKAPIQEVALPPTLTRYLVDFVGQEVAQARAALETDLAAAQQAQADLIAEAERTAADLASLTTELDAERESKAAALGKLGQVDHDLAAAKEEATRERQAAEAARTELAKAQLRLESLPRLEAEATQLRADLDTERSKRHEAERTAAAADARAAGLAERLADAQASIVKIADGAAIEAGRFEATIVKLEKKLEGAELAATHARTRADLAEQELKYTAIRKNSEQPKEAAKAKPKAKRAAPQPVV